jgi:hypothetical protein
MKQSADLDYFLPDDQITLEFSDSSVPPPSAFLLSMHAKIGKMLHVSKLATSRSG